MEKVGLVHFSVQSFTDFLNSNWHEINSWWESEDVQGAIKEYLARFGYLTRFPLVEIRRVLLSTGR
jgi:hypothetical protein